MESMDDELHRIMPKLSEYYKKPLGEILRKQGVIPMDKRELIVDCLNEQARNKKKLGVLLVERGICSQAQVDEALRLQNTV